MTGFLAMGVYGVYVWTAFGVTTAVIIGNVLAARRRLQSTRERLQLQLLRRGTAPGGEGVAPLLARIEPGKREPS